MIELLCTDYNKKATSIHYYFGNAVLAIKSFDGVRQKGKEIKKQQSRYGSAAMWMVSKSKLAKVNGKVLIYVDFNRIGKSVNGRRCFIWKIKKHNNFPGRVYNPAFTYPCLLIEGRFFIIVYSFHSLPGGTRQTELGIPRRNHYCSGIYSIISPGWQFRS